MSKYKEIKTQIKSKEFIVRALGEMGVPCSIANEGEKLALHGWHGDKRPEVADVVVNRRHVSAYSNDLGWVYDPTSGSYAEIVSEYDSHGRGAEIAQQVRQKCALYAVQELAQANGYTCTVVEEHGVQRVFLGGAQ